MPLVTIGVPYYNAEKYILSTLESIKNQSYQNIELILINEFIESILNKISLYEFFI